MAVTINGTTGITTPDITSDSATIDGTTLVVDETNNRVGIGTSSPSGTLQLRETTPSLYITSDNSGTGYIYFGGASTPARAAIYHDDTDDSLAFRTAGAERMAITSGGTLQFNSGYGSVATAFGCRAWIQFGMDSGGISGSGGVSSITDIGVGHFRVNLSFTAPDTAYSVQVSDNYGQAFTETYTTTNFRVKAYNANYALRDSTLYMAAMFR